MKTIELYEEAMCCPTGICGPSVDEELLMVASIYEQFDRSGQVEAKRYNLAQEPQAFVENKEAKSLLNKNGKKILPITFVDGEVVKTGAYPSPEEFSQFTGYQVDYKAKA